MSVPAAWIRKQEHWYTSQSNCLKSQRQPGGCPCSREEDRTKDGYAKKRDDRGAIAIDFPLQSSDAGSIFTRFEDINACAAAADDIRESQSPFWQSPVVSIGQGFMNETGFIQ